MDARQYTKNTINVLLAGLIAYTLIFTAASWMRVLIPFGDGYLTLIVGVLAGVVMLLVYATRCGMPVKAVFYRERRMSAGTFFQFLTVFAAGQLLFSAFNVFLEYCLNLIGFSIYSSVAEATGASTNLGRFIYACLIVPVTEELIYRGLCLRYAQRFGRVFAIVFSAALFGIMHGNLPQAGFAFYIGLVLGTVAVEYSIVYAMLLHFINNFLFGEVLELVLTPLPLRQQNALYYLIFGTFFFLAVIVVIVRRRDIAAYLVRHRAPPGTYRYAFFAVMTMIFIALHLARALYLLDRI